MKKKSISFWIKMLIFLLTSGLLYYILRSNEKMNETYLSELQKGWKSYAFLMFLTIILVPLNWSLEAYKWKYLISKIERISFWTALEGVIIGVSMGFVTPHSLGDYAARILTLKNHERLKGIGAVFMSRISQFYITLCFGSISVMYYVFRQIQEGVVSYFWIIVFTIVCNVLFVLIFIYHNTILRLFSRIPFLKKFTDYFDVIRQYSFGELKEVLLLSLLRYSVFCIQFVLLLLCFGIVLPWWLLVLGVVFIFFVKSVVPTIFDIGVRETAALIFFGAFAVQQQNVLFASLTLWLLNLVFPAFVGLVLIFRIRLFSKENDSQ